MSEERLTVRVYNADGSELQTFSNVESMATAIDLVGASMGADGNTGGKAYRVRIENQNGSGFWMSISDKKGSHHKP